jgi:hypothetical protein
MAQAVSRRPLTAEARVRSLPIPVAARFKAWVYGRSLVGIVGSNPAGGMDVCVVLLYKDSSMEHEGQKDLKVQKMDQRVFSFDPFYKEKKIPGQSMWDLWCIKWHWDRFSPQYFGFTLSVSFHRCSMTRKNEKTSHLHHRAAQ